MQGRDATRESGTAQALAELPNGHWRVNGVKVEFRLRNADITTKLSFIGANGISSSLGLSSDKSMVLRRRSTSLQQNSAPYWLDGDYAGSRKRSEASPAEWSTDARSERSKPGRIRG